MGDRVRVFYASCDDRMRGRVFHADFRPEPPFGLISVGDAPVLDLGAAGAFDMDGVNPSQIIETGEGLVLLYIGWRRGPAEAPYTLFAGVALSHDGGRSFQRRAEPLLPPRPGETLFRTAPFIQRADDGWRLLYIGGDRFDTGEGGKRWPRYSLMQMTGEDLLAWPGGGSVLLAPDVAAGEIGFGRPVVVAREGGARLMLSVRTRDGYRLVETTPEIAPGERPQMTGVALDPLEAWEGRMTCFGAVCQAGDNELLFYNGDGFGRTGMGLAWRPLA